MDDVARPVCRRTYLPKLLNMAAVIGVTIENRSGYSRNRFQVTHIGISVAISFLTAYYNK